MKKAVIILTTLVTALAIGAPAMANEAEGGYEAGYRQHHGQREWRGQRGERRGRHHHGRGFRRGGKSVMVGVCAGQKLAAKGITLPAPKAGERSQLDEATKKELFASLKACKEEFRAARKGKRGGDKEEKKEDEQEQG